jgi:hypothetical protein
VIHVTGVIGDIGENGMQQAGNGVIGVKQAGDGGCRPATEVAA